MLSGFLPVARASTLMFDVVVVAMLPVLVLLTWSIYLVKYRQAYELHKKIQVLLGVVLLVAVLLFEIDIRLDSSWWDRALASPFHTSGVLKPFLGVHLFFAISTTLLWIVTIPLALRRFPNPPAPNEHSPLHLKLGKLAAIGMYATGVTGWTFYYMAFIAT